MQKYDDSEQIIIQKGIAARATLSGFNQNYRSDKRPKKFIVTLKPVSKPGKEKGFNEDRRAKSAHEHGRVHLKTDETMRGRATILNAFRLLAHSKFIDIDQNASNAKNVTRLSGGSDDKVKPKETKPEQRKEVRSKRSKENEARKKEVKKREEKEAKTAEERRESKNIQTDNIIAEITATTGTAIPTKTERSRKDNSKRRERPRRRDGVPCCMCGSSSTVMLIEPEEPKKKEPKKEEPKKEEPKIEEPKKEEPKKEEPKQEEPKVVEPIPIKETTSTKETQTTIETSQDKLVTEICKPRELKKHSEVIKNDCQNDLNVRSHHSQRACNRIIHLEQQVEGMRKELSRIKREFIPQEEVVRYSALALRLRDLNVLLTEMKQSCTASMVTTTSTGTTQSNYNNEHVQIVQNYRPCKPKCQTGGCGNKTQPTVACAAMAKATDPLFVQIKQPEVDPRPEAPPKTYTTCGTQPEPKLTIDSSVQVRRSPENALRAESHDRHSQTSEMNLLRTTPEEEEQTPLPESAVRRHSILDTFAERVHSTPSDRMISILEHRRKSNEPTRINYRKIDSSSEVNNGKKNKSITPRNDGEKTKKLQNMPPNNSFCHYCEGAEVPILNSNLQSEIRRIVGQVNPNDVALTIVLQSDNLYHINIAVMRTGESLGCLYATEAAINRANDERVFQVFLTFFVVDANNTMEQKNKILGHTFEFIKD